MANLDTKQMCNGSEKLVGISDDDLNGNPPQDDNKSATNQLLLRQLVPTPYKQMPLTAAFQYILQQIGNGGASFPAELLNFDFAKPPSNWLRARSFWEHRLLNRFLQQHANDNMTMFRSFEMGDPLVLRNFDVVSHASNIKRLMKMAYSKQPISMLVHRVGRTLFIDAFDIHEFLLRNERNEYDWLRRFYQEQHGSDKKYKLTRRDHSRYTLQQRDLLFKLLYYAAQQFDRKHANLHRQTSSNATSDEHLRQSITSENSFGSLSSGSRGQKAGEPRNLGSESANRHDSETGCCETLEWHFEDLEMLFGTDLAIFGSRKRPAISVRVCDRDRPITVLTGIDYWLDNLMCNVPELAMVYHINGVLREFELLKTDQIPLGTFGPSQHGSGSFDPLVLREIAADVLAFLRRNATHEGHTYWLFKPYNSDVVKLYDLSSLYEATKMRCGETESKKTSDTTQQQSRSRPPSTSASPGETVPNEDAASNPFAMPVAFLLYRTAFSLYRSGVNGRKHRRTICRLLENCLKLLASADATRTRTDADRELIVSANYILSDLHLPANVGDSNANADANADVNSDDEYANGDENEYEVESESAYCSESDERETDATSGPALAPRARQRCVTISVAEMRVPDPNSVTCRVRSGTAPIGSRSKFMAANSALQASCGTCSLLPARRRYELALEHALACIAAFQDAIRVQHDCPADELSQSQSLATLAGSAASSSSWLLDPTRARSASNAPSNPAKFDCSSLVSNSEDLPNRCVHTTYAPSSRCVPLSVLIKAALASYMLARTARSQTQYGATLRFAQLGLACFTPIAVDRRAVLRELNTTTQRPAGNAGTNAINVSAKRRKRPTRQLTGESSDETPVSFCTLVRLKASLQILFADACARVAFADATQLAAFHAQFDEAVTATQSRVVARLTHAASHPKDDNDSDNDNDSELPNSLPRQDDALKLAATIYAATFGLFLDDSMCSALSLPTDDDPQSDTTELTLRWNNTVKETVAKRVALVERLVGEPEVLKRFANVLNELGVRAMRRVEEEVVVLENSVHSFNQPARQEPDRLLRRAQIAFDCAGDALNCAFVALNRARFAKLKLHCALTCYGQSLEAASDAANDESTVGRLVNKYRDAIDCFTEAAKFVDIDQRARDTKETSMLCEQVTLDCANLAYQFGVFLQESVVSACRGDQEESSSEHACIGVLNEALSFANRLARDSVFTLTRVANLHYRLASISHDAVRLRAAEWSPVRRKQYAQLCRTQYEKALAALNDPTILHAGDKLVRLRAAVERIRVYLEMAMFETRLTHFANEAGAKGAPKKGGHKHGLDIATSRTLLNSVRDSLPTNQSDLAKVDDKFCNDALLILGALAIRLQNAETNATRRQILEKVYNLIASQCHNTNLDKRLDRLLDVTSERVHSMVSNENVPSKLDTIRSAVESLLSAPAHK